MVNPHGTPIWYELMTPDSGASASFYEGVIGWRVAQPTAGPMDYRQIDTGSAAVGGMLALSPQMLEGGARPGWMVYIGVDDVDAAAGELVRNGGSIHIPPRDLPGVGRMAMVADPQGTAFYIMRGFSEEDSKAWERTGMGKCNWQELSSPDPEAARRFYADVFGWSFPDSMPMPGGGSYEFIDVGGQTIGAIMPAGREQPDGWMLYFRAPDIDRAAANVKESGGTVRSGPMEVPGGDRIITAADPQGIPFGIAAPGQT